LQFDFLSPTGGEEVIDHSEAAITIRSDNFASGSEFGAQTRFEPGAIGGSDSKTLPISEIVA
jgi:hypothetical protein